MRSPLIGFIALLLVGCGSFGGASNEPSQTTSGTAPASSAASSAAATDSASSRTVAPPQTMVATRQSNAPAPQPPAPPAPAPIEEISWSNAKQESKVSYSKSAFNVVAVRVGYHDEYDRVVIDLSGGNASDLRWTAEYVNSPVSQGAGFPIDLESDAYFEIWLSGIALPTEGSQLPQGKIKQTITGNLTGGAYVDISFEGEQRVYVGLDRRRGFRTMTLENPARLVIDFER